MHSIASFESITVRTAHYFTLKNMFRDTDLRLLFDSGASYSVIGINTEKMINDNQRQDI